MITGNNLEIVKNKIQGSDEVKRAFADYMDKLIRDEESKVKAIYNSRQVEQNFEREVSILLGKVETLNLVKSTILQEKQESKVADN